MGIFQRVEAIDATQTIVRRPYFQPGNYKVRVIECKANNSRNGDSFFIVEAEVLESNNPNVLPGAVHAWLCKMNNDAGPANVKHFIAVANGIDPRSQQANEEVTEEVCEMVVSDQQPLRGLELKLQCNEVTTKKGMPFTQHTWTSMSPEQ